jgi:transcriptional regulator with XRE-family HTH domain
MATACRSCSYVAMKFSEKLREARKTTGLTQADVRDRLGPDQAEISRWELGKVMPDTQRIIDLATLYGVPLDWLLDDSRTESATLAREIAGYVRDLGYQGIRSKIIGEGLRRMGGEDQT